MKKPTTPPKTISIEAARLKPHPLLKQTGMLSRLVSREEALAKKGGDKKALHLEKKETLQLHLAALEADIRENGIRKPIEVCPAGDKKMGFHILDGRHRWEIAKKIKLTKVPCIIAEATQAKEIILSATLTKPMSKGASAYLAVLIHPEVATEERRGKNSLSEFLTAKELAARSGVSEGLMIEAIKLYNFFHKTGKKDAEGALLFVAGAKAKFEDAIFTPGGSLRATIGAVVSMRDGEDKNSTKITPAEKWDGAKALTRRRMKEFAEKTEGHFAKAGEAEKEELLTLCAADLLTWGEHLAPALARKVLERIGEEE